MTDQERRLFRIRTITCFVCLKQDDFSTGTIREKIGEAAAFLQSASKALSEAGYVVQTIRITVNPFGQWMLRPDNELQALDKLLDEHGIQFCSVGPAESWAQLKQIKQIINFSGKFSCSASLQQNDVAFATECATVVKEIASLDSGDHVKNGLGNFRFCVSAAAVDGIPFFPVSKAQHDKTFAVGLENGELAQTLLGRCKTLANVPFIFGSGMEEELVPLQQLLLKLEGEFTYTGIDTSLNPSLDERGSVATAIEMLSEVKVLGGVGSLAAASVITQTLQSLPNIKHCGYSGLMLPVCEDQRLAQLATSASSLTITSLLNISSVCGVGVDTVPVPGNCSVEDLTSLYLDVAGLAYRWNKSLSCRVFPVPDKVAGECTSFNSPYMVNSKVMDFS